MVREVIERLLDGGGFRLRVDDKEILLRFRGSCDMLDNQIR